MIRPIKLGVFRVENNCIRKYINESRNLFRLVDSAVVTTSSAQIDNNTEECELNNSTEMALNWQDTTSWGE